MKMNPAFPTAAVGIVGSLLLSMASLQAANTISTDFNDSSDLTTLFNPTEGAQDYNTTSGGLGGSGMVQMAPGTTFGKNVWTSVTGFSNAVGNTYSVSLYINGGDGGIGFSIVDVDRPYDNAAPGTSMGVTLSGGGGVGGGAFFDNIVPWESSTVNLDSFPLGEWELVTLSLTSLGGDQYSMHVVVQNSDPNGFVGETFLDSTTVMSNENLSSASILYPFFLSGATTSNVDNFSASVEAVPEPSTCALLLLGCAASFTMARRRKAA